MGGRIWLVKHSRTSISRDVLVLKGQGWKLVVGPKQSRRRGLPEEVQCVERQAVHHDLTRREGRRSVT